MNIIFLILLSLFLNVRLSQGAVEIYSAGKHFDSLEAYKGTGSISPQTQQEAVILDPGQQGLNKISYNNGVHHVVVNFKQNWNNPKPRFIIGADELEYTIAEIMKNQREPTLLISDPKKLRIMSYGATIDKTVKKREGL